MTIRSTWIPILSLLCFVQFGYPQKPVVLETNPPPAMGSREEIKVSGTAKASYESRTDRTIANSQAIRIELPNGGWGSITAAFFSKGKSVLVPDSIEIRVFTAAKDRAYVDNPNIEISVDGRKLFSGVGQLSSARTNGVEIYTGFTATLTREQFEMIANSKNVVIVQGPGSWEIDFVKMKVFKDLVELYR